MHHTFPTVPLPPITTGPDLIAFMRRVWGDVCEPLPDGGMLVYHPEPDLYDAWSDAILVARAIGAQFMWGAPHDRRVYQLANGDRVAIDRDGNGITPIKRHRPRIG